MSKLVEIKNYKETRKAYYRNNKEKIDNQSKKYALLHPELIKQNSRRWYEKNKEYIKEKMQVVKESPDFKKKRSSYNKKYREGSKVRLRKYYIENRDKILTRTRNYTYKRNFGITIEEYDRMLKDQNQSCGICKISEKKWRKRFSVDHCHKTGKVRGLLCGKCNSVLGFVSDSTEILSNCINYLNK